jgi:2-polyprenyl-3-methyl-5-hydroxy-6-metoxy-1,4-benzoquinol methylase
MSELQGIVAYPNLRFLATRQITMTPDLEASLTRRLTSASPEHLAVLERQAERIQKLVGVKLDQFCSDYQWICEAMMREELDFRRSGNYRYSTFQQAYDEVYSDSEFMRHYMNGLLMTQLWWSNHTETFDFFERAYLPRLPDKYRHLEIGTGHGLYLCPPAFDAKCESLEGWDISAASIEATRECLGSMDVGRPVNLIIQDLFAVDASKTGTFDSIVFSEVLEHLDKPGEALNNISSLMSNDGLLFLNIPINSPAPDHIFLLRSPEEVIEFVEAHGLVVIDSLFAPQTGMTLGDARAKGKTISVALIAEKRRP